MNLTAIKKESPANDESANVGRNLLWMVWSGAVSIAGGILIWVFMARLRDVEELGRFTIVMGLYALFFGICSLGLIPFLVSEISRRKARTEQACKKISSFIGSASVFLLISGAGCALLMAVCGFFVSDSLSVRVSVSILSLAMIPTGLTAAAEANAVAFGRTRLIASVTTVENVLKIAAPLGLIWFGFGIPAICVAFVVVRFLALLLFILAESGQIRNFSFDTADFRKIAKASPIFAGTIIFASINFQAVIILLGYFTTEAESAKYGVASRFFIPVSILMASYASVIQPVITKFIESERFGLNLSKLARYPLILATSGAIASPFLSRCVLSAFFGDKYANASTTLDVLALSVVPFCLVMIAARGLVAANAQHVDLIANAAGVIASLSGGILLIPLYGAVGAASAQLFSFLLMALIEVGYLSRKATGFNIWRTASLSSACLLLTYLIIWKY